MRDAVQFAKQILAANEEVLFGIFGQIGRSRYFPPQEYLNEFFKQGSDPCDQDSRMGQWRPFVLSMTEFEDVFSWWAERHPGTVVTDLDTSSWHNWIQVILQQD
jgi:hypothetical protein